MDHLQIILRLILILVVSSNAVRSPPAIPHREELDYLTSEEEERLIFGGDESVISEKIRDIPSMNTTPPKSRRLKPAPMPTMDPPLPKRKSLNKPPKSNRGFPFRIPRIFLNNAARLITPLNRKPRWRSESQNQNPVASFRARPSTLVSSEPDQLEVAFKRIEIMASRAGLNMSSMPRRTQMQVLKKLMPKLPPRMSYMVKSAMEGDSEKMYHYLPEPAKDPFEDSPMPGSGPYINEDIHDDFHEENESVQRPVVREPGFDAGKISIANHDANLEEFAHLPSITENYRTGSLSHDLLPPSLDDNFGKQQKHSNSFGDSFGDSSHQFEREPQYGRDTKLGTDSGKIYASPLVSTNEEDKDAEASENLPMVISAGTLYKSNKVTHKYSKNSTPTPIRVSLPTKDRFLTVKPTPRPIRVSIISKDTINVNKTEPLVKVVHVEPTTDEEKEEEIPAVVEEVKAEESKHVGLSSDEVSKLTTRVKEISVDIIKEEEAKHKLIEAKRKSTSTTTTTTTTTTMSPDLLKLDMYDDWSEGAEEPWSDPYDLTDEEIAATVAELKKYEEQGVFENSLEQDFPWRLAPHPLEYPDHPDHPKDSFEDTKSSDKDKSTTSAPSQSAVMKRPSVPFNGPFRRPPGHMGPGRRPPMRRPPMKRPLPPHARRPPPRPPGSPPRPLRINDVTVSELPKEYNKECDYFSDDLCLLVQDYPIEAITEALEQHPEAGNLLVKEPEAERSWVDGVQRNQEYNYNFKHYFGQRRNDEETTHRHRDFAGEGGFLCPSKVAYGKIKKAKSSTTGDWKYVVNYADKTQTLRLEKCLSPGNTCSYVMPHYRTACTQVYNYHRLLAWDSEKGLHIDVFKVPTCCTCHVQGYYIPGNQHGFSPARGRDLAPKLKFTPPRTPMGRGLKRVPPGLNDIIHDRERVVNKPTTTTSSTAAPSTSTKSATKELKDDLQDLLAQYSALREKIAKTKKDNVKVSYSMSVSNTTDSLRPKTRESRTSQFPFNMTDLKPLLKLKRLQMKMKKMNGTTQRKYKRPLARALLLARRTLRSQMARGRSLKVEPRNKTINVKERIQTLRTRLNKYMERSKTKNGVNRGPSEQQEISSTKPASKNNQNTTSNSKRPNQRLRLSSNRPSKVNYSYHPIMDYFGSKPRTR